jgi:phosphoserine phosphatase
VTQVRAMLRMAVRLGADIDAAFVQINDQLVQDLAANRFVTAILGVLDATTHTITYHSGGQGPLLQWHASPGTCESRGATTFPMGMMEVLHPTKPEIFAMAPGDIVCLSSDGIYEYPDTADDFFGEARVAELIAAHRHEPMSQLIERIVGAVEAFGVGVPQPDDMTLLLIRRLG